MKQLHALASSATTVKQFPINFMWGSATAAHQVEGGNANADLWALERATPSLFKEPSGDAIDHWNRFSDDMALLAALGINHYRFSVEWARIEPEEGVFSHAALSHYQKCIDTCLRLGIKPALTMQHFTLPLWVARRGGFAAHDFPDLFARYCKQVALSLRGFDTVFTINELNIPILVEPRITALLSSEQGKVLAAAAEEASGAKIESAFLFTPPAVILSNGLAAHAKGRDAIKAVRPDCQVGVTLSIQDEQAAPGAEPVRDARRESIYGCLLDDVKGDDFIGVQTYTRMVAQPDGTVGPEPGHPLTMMGYEDRPQALAEVCRFVWERTNTPILVTENGWAGENDERRVAFIHEALSCLHEVIGEGVKVTGYFYWSLFDNFEWLDGYRPKFGIIGVDRSTQRRQVRRSAFVYGQIAQANELAPAEQSTPLSGTPDAASVPSAGGVPVGMNLG